MGLDWVLQRRKPKEGQEFVARRLEQRLQEVVRQHLSEDVKRLEAELEAATVSPFELMGAPRVGVDEAATEWFRKHIALESGGPSLEQVLKEAHGRFVPELARDAEGLAAITGLFVSSVDFRGKVVALAEGLPEGLAREAYDDHPPRAALDYAARLERVLTRLHGRTQLNVREAARWLRYWGQRGFGYDAWY